ncbi:MAG: hypothetical protein MUF01_14745 [Bryobacterales bacterium]|jgi:hypothetical protein|nr:hypothetical protein [Bryobacterales bacterium]
MSYLDNLENSLKALESSEERDPAAVAAQQQRRAEERNAAVLRAPYVRALKSSAFTGQLLGACRKLGPTLGVYVQVTWVDEALRLDVREHRLSLTPTSEGIEAIFSRDQKELQRYAISLDGDGEALARQWLEGLPR